MASGEGTQDIPLAIRSGHKAQVRLPGLAQR